MVCKAGDKVKKMIYLCEVQNDKAVVEIPSPVKGKVEEVLVVEGTVAVVGDVFIKLDAPGYEDLKFKGDIAMRSGKKKQKHKFKQLLKQVKQLKKKQLKLQNKAASAENAPTAVVKHKQR